MVVQATTCARRDRADTSGLVSFALGSAEPLAVGTPRGGLSAPFDGLPMNLKLNLAK